MEGIDLYKAIDEMKAITADGGTFDIKFRKWDRHRKRGGDVCRIPRCRLRPKSSDEQIDHASHKLFVYDVEAEKPRVCWQPLIVEFNGMPVILN